MTPVLDAMHRQALLGCLEYWKTEPLPPERRVICFSWVVRWLRNRLVPS